MYGIHNCTEYYWYVTNSLWLYKQFLKDFIGKQIKLVKVNIYKLSLNYNRNKAYSFKQLPQKKKTI